MQHLAFNHLLGRWSSVSIGMSSDAHDDSESMCKACFHAMVLTDDADGQVRSSISNGCSIDSNRHEAFEGSFVVSEQQSRFVALWLWHHVSYELNLDIYPICIPIMSV